MNLKEQSKLLEDYNLKVIMVLSEFMSDRKLWDDFYDLFDKEYPGERLNVYEVITNNDRQGK